MHVVPVLPPRHALPTTIAHPEDWRVVQLRFTGERREVYAAPRLLDEPRHADV